MSAHDNVTTISPIPISVFPIRNSAHTPIANRFSSELTFFNMNGTKLNDPSENTIAFIYGCTVHSAHTYIKRTERKTISSV